MPPTDRVKRVMTYLTPDEQRAIRLRAAEAGVSMSELMREVMLAYVRGQVVITPQLPAVNHGDIPSWLTASPE